MKFLKGIWHRSDKEQKKKKKKKERKEGKEGGLYKERGRICPPERGLFSSGYRPLPFVRKINFPVPFLFRPRSLTTHTRSPNKNVSCCSLAPESTERRKDFNKHSVRRRLLAAGSSESLRDGITVSGGKRALNLIDRERDRIKKNPDFNLFAGRNTRLRLLPPWNSRIISLAYDRFEEARSPTLLDRKSC